MGLRLMQEETVDLFSEPSKGNQEEFPIFREGDRPLKTIDAEPSTEQAQESRHLTDVLELTQQMIGSVDSAVDVLNDLVSVALTTRLFRIGTYPFN